MNICVTAFGCDVQFLGVGFNGGGKSVLSMGGVVNCGHSPVSKCVSWAYGNVCLCVFVFSSRVSQIMHSLLC